VGLDVKIKAVGGEQCVVVGQEEDLLAYLDTIGVGEVKLVDNPMPNKYAMYKNQVPLEGGEAQWYRSVVGALNFYACATRYDIAFPVSKLSQFCARPTQGSKEALLRVLAYLKTHPDFTLVGRFGGESNTVEVFSDSDHAGEREVDTRSQSGMLILLNGVPVHWRSVKQVSTAVSSACAEIYAL